MFMKYLLPLTILSFAPVSCAISGLNKGKADREEAARTAQKRDELNEDAGRPFQPLIDTKTLPKTVEIWRPTDRLSLWTPKGDAVFYAGEGAVLDFEKKTVQFVTKEKSGGPQLSSVMNLSDEVWVSWLEAFAKINKVEKKAGERKCSPNVLDAQEHIVLKSDENQKYVLNYRVADCEAELTDTLSLDRVFVWLENHGAPWAQ